MIEMMTAAGKPPMAKGNIKKFDAGEKGIVALSDSGRLYSIGDSFFSGTGAATTTWGLLSGGVENFWLAYRSLLVLTTDGRWLALGTNSYFPTAAGSVFTTLTDVSSYMAYPAGLTIREVCFGFRALAVVFTNGQYAMCGLNPSGGLGTGNTVGVRGLTMRTDFTNVKKLDFDKQTSDTSYMLLNTGEVYVAGLSSNGQAGVINSVVSTWRKQADAGNTVDINAAIVGWFRIVETTTGYAIYAQGQQFGGSLGTGATTSTNYINPTLVGPQIADKSKGPPVVYPGLYSARFVHPNGILYYTGSSSGLLQGIQSSNQTDKYSFTALPEPIVKGAYYFVRGGYTSSYALSNGVLYGCGQDSTNGLLPGLGTTRSFPYVPLDTTPII